MPRVMQGLTIQMPALIWGLLLCSCPICLAKRHTDSTLETGQIIGDAISSNPATGLSPDRNSSRTSPNALKMLRMRRKACRGDYFPRCAGSSVLCMSHDARCNGWVNGDVCNGDGSDELDCVNYKCRGGYTKCGGSSGLCVNQLRRCNGVPDKWLCNKNGSDETDCKKYQCSGNMQTCGGTSGLCVWHGARCNGKVDKWACGGDGSDELDCDGGWTSWFDWSACPVPCGSGWKTRSRSCSNPPRHARGAPCTGDIYQHTPCKAGACPIDSYWSPWSAWAACTVPCGVGIQTRRRNCSNTHAQHGGADCYGSSYGARRCGEDICPAEYKTTVKNLDTTGHPTGHTPGHPSEHPTEHPTEHTPGHTPAADVGGPARPKPNQPADARDKNDMMTTRHTPASTDEDSTLAYIVGGVVGVLVVLVLTGLVALHSWKKYRRRRVQN